ncbi:hypothetical protein LT875_002533 [Salmonella enterica]|nr:hypothetical protein [Salmonella enterica]
MLNIITLTKEQKAVIEFSVFHNLIKFFEDTSYGLSGDDVAKIRDYLGKDRFTDEEFGQITLILFGGDDNGLMQYAAMADEPALRKFRDALNEHYVDTPLRLGDCWLQAVRIMAAQIKCNGLDTFQIQPSQQVYDKNGAIKPNSAPQELTDVYEFTYTSPMQFAINSVRVYEMYSSVSDKYHISISNGDAPNFQNKITLTPIPGKIKAGDVICLKILADLHNGYQAQDWFSIHY